MAVASTAVGTVTMFIMTAMPWYLCLFGAAIASLFGAYTELITRDGNDTLTVPVINSIVLLLFHFAAIG